MSDNDREVLILAIKDHWMLERNDETVAKTLTRTTWNCALDCAIEIIRAFKGEPVVRGEWITPTVISGRAYDIPHCSNYGKTTCCKGKFCPNCGADMRSNHD